MKKLLISLFLFFLACGVQGQNISKAELTAFCERAIFENFNAFYSVEKEGTILITKDSLFPSINQQYTNLKLHFVNEQQACAIIGKRKDKKGFLHHAYLKKSINTIDINFSYHTIEVKRCFKIRKGRLITKIHHFALSCGGTMGYIPSARLILNKEKRVWEYLSNEALVKQVSLRIERKRTEMLEKE